MFKLNINNNNISFAYMIDSLSLRHNHLGHVNTKRLQDMTKLKLIPIYNHDKIEICKIFPQTKITKLQLNT